MPVVLGATWPLVGRDEEVALLAEALGGGGGCVLSGRAGVGKTRLALEVAERARASGRDVEWLVATAGTSRISLGAFAPVLGEPPPLVSEGELLHWARQRLAARPGLVLCVDDAHLLDGASASILLQLAARGEAFVVATIRSGEPCPEELVGLWKDGWAERVEVLPLGRRETAELAEHGLGAEPTPATSERLFELSRGIPLYLRELLVAGLEEGAIVDADDDRKHWEGPVVPTPRLTELVATRLARLDDDERDAALTIALGEPIDVRTAECAVDADIVGVIEERGLVTADHAAGRPVLRMSHPLYGEVLRETLPVARTRELYGRLADAAEQVGYADDDVLRVATWRLECDDHSDPEGLLAAGQRALRTSDTELAERLGRAAADAGGGPRAQLLIADALYLANEWDDAATALAALATSDLDDDTRAATAIRRSSMLIWWAGDPAAANDALAEAAAEITDPALRAEVDTERVWPLVVSDRLDEAVAVVPDGAEDASHTHATMHAYPAMVTATALKGLTGDSMRIAERGAALAASEAETAPMVDGELLIATCFAMWLDGRVAEAEDLARRAVGGPAEDWSEVGQALVGFIEGKAAFERGHAERAVRTIDPAINVLRSYEWPFVPWALYVLARAHALQGDATAASQALVAGDEVRNPAVRLQEPDRTFATAAIRDMEQPGVSRGMLAEASRDFESWGALPYALLALTDAVRLGHRDPFDAERAAAIASRCQGTLAPALSSFVRGAVARDPSRLRESATELETAGHDLAAAEASLLAAEMLDHDGRRGTALGARQRANTLLERCGRVRTPIVTSATSELPLARLTRREREVAQLVGSGLTNRAVAERLHLSGRTVDNHVQSIFVKLGIHERGALEELG